MSNLRNSVQLIGNLGQTPEVRTLESGMKVVRFSIATNENYKNKAGEWQTETQWHTITAWNQLADRMATQLDKGSFVLIEGKLVNRNYTAANGEKKYVTEIQANAFLILDKKDNDAKLSSTSENTTIVPMLNEDDLPF